MVVFVREGGGGGGNMVMSLRECVCVGVCLPPSPRYGLIVTILASA